MKPRSLNLAGAIAGVAVALAVALAVSLSSTSQTPMQATAFTALVTTPHQGVAHSPDAGPPLLAGPVETESHVIYREKMSGQAIVRHRFLHHLQRVRAARQKARELAAERAAAILAAKKQAAAAATPAPQPATPQAAPAAPPSSSGIYSYTALESLWESVGGPSWAAPAAATIAECESGGNPRAYNVSGATGLWQILGAVVGGDLTDPTVNAENAVSKFHASGDTFAQWVCQA